MSKHPETIWRWWLLVVWRKTGPALGKIDISKNLPIFFFLWPNNSKNKTNRKPCKAKFAFLEVFSRIFFWYKKGTWIFPCFPATSTEAPRRGTGATPAGTRRVLLPEAYGREWRGNGGGGHGGRGWRLWGSWLWRRLILRRSGVAPGPWLAAAEAAQVPPEGSPPGVCPRDSLGSGSHAHGGLTCCACFF